MPLYGIDISHHQPGINLQKVKDEGFDYVFARVGQGAGRRTNGNTYGTVQDREWSRNKSEARRVGLVLCAYWYVGNLITPDENARLCDAWMGDKSIPVALDCEDGSGSIAFFRATVDSFRARGLRVALSYVPRWYWQSVGSQSLEGLPPLWSSRYVSGDGSASALYPGDGSSLWDGYGNNNVAVLQYSSSANVAGLSAVDVDAFKGTREQFIQLITGKQTPPSIPPPVVPPVEVDMQLDDIVGTLPDGKVVRVRDALMNTYLQKQIDVRVESLPVDQKKEFNQLRDLLYALHGQASWSDLSGLTWADLAGKRWCDL